MGKLIHEKGMFSLTIADDGIIEWLTRHFEHDQQKAGDDMMSLLSAIDQLFTSQPKQQFIFLVDVRPVYTQTYLLPDSAKDVYSDLLRHPQLKKAAVLGANTFLSRITEIMVNMTKKWNKLRFFRDENKARQWLLSPEE